jgi:predicted GNAT family N-acyltransferase
MSSEMIGKKIDKTLLEDIKTILQKSRHSLQQTVNTTMVQTYWHIGRLIVEDEQKGNERAEYGKRQLESIAETLTKEFGKGFDITNLRKMRQFYKVFPIQDTVCLELSWSHYRRLIRIEKEKET